MMQTVKEYLGIVLCGAMIALGVRQCAIMESEHLQKQDQILLEKRHAEGLISTADRQLIEWRLQDEQHRINPN